MVEAAIIFPCLVLILYWSAAITDVMVLKLKAAEALRYSLWESTVYKAPRQIDSEVRQRFVDLRHQNGLEVLGRDGSDELVGNARIAADDEGFGNAIDAPLDCRAAVLVGAGGGEWIAVAAEKSPRVVGVVFVIDANHAQALILR